MSSSNSTKGQAGEMIFAIIRNFHIPSFYTSRKQCRFLLLPFGKAQVEQNLPKSKLCRAYDLQALVNQTSYLISLQESQTLTLPLLYFVWPDDVCLQPIVD